MGAVILGCYAVAEQQKKGVRRIFQQIWTGENRKTLVCVDSYHSGVLDGRIYNPCHEVENFESLTQFLIKMENLLDEQQIPQAYNTMRTFSDVFPYWSSSAPAGTGCKGSKATFEIKVLFRQHSSWQGTVTWREKQLEQSFRSVLELVILMDSALRAEEGFGTK